MEIRRLTDHDAEAYRHLRLEALECEPTAFTETVAEHQNMTLEATKNRLGPESSPDNFVLGAFIEGQLIGISGFYRRQGEKLRHRGKIWGVYVSEKYRGRGIAQQLLRELIRMVEALSGMEQVALAVSTHNSPAKHLYESLGFELYGCERRALKEGDRYIDEELMVLYFKR